MTRLDLLRVSLLASLTACGPGLGDSEGNTTTTDGSTGTGDGTETGEACTLGCEGGTEIADGVLQCPDGTLNRVAAGTYDPAIGAAACMGDEMTLNCTSDADCTESAYGKCIHNSWTDDFGETTTNCGCAYACASDGDCDPDQVCLAPGVLPSTPNWPHCRSADCTTNADCGECGECGLGAYDDGCGFSVAIQCRTPADACSSDGQCDEYCFPDYEDTWICQGHQCDIGRPLLVDAVARTAPPCSRVDWVGAPDVTDGLVALVQDPELAAYWASVAALEHASVASFARFGRQLLALGAPPELLRATQQAARDEVEHARLAYGLASAYGGAPIGPGRLSLHGVVTATSWREVVGALIQEACVAETLGVAEAMAAADAATVPVVCAVLERIAADELRHAQLAWRSLAWLLRAGEPDDRAWAMALLEGTIAAVGGVGSGLNRPEDGVLGGARRVRLHRDAGAQVLGPLALALAA